MFYYSSFLDCGSLVISLNFIINIPGNIYHCKLWIILNIFNNIFTIILVDFVIMIYLIYNRLYDYWIICKILSIFSHKTIPKFKYSNNFINNSVFFQFVHRVEKGGRGAEPPNSNQGLSPLICTQDCVHKNLLTEEVSNRT